MRGRGGGGGEGGGGGGKVLSLHLLEVQGEEGEELQINGNVNQLRFTIHIFWFS